MNPSLTKKQALAVVTAMLAQKTVGVSEGDEVSFIEAASLHAALEALLGVGNLPYESMLRAHAHRTDGNYAAIKGLRPLLELLRQVAEVLLEPVTEARVDTEGAAQLAATLSVHPTKPEVLLLRVQNVPQYGDEDLRDVAVDVTGLPHQAYAVSRIIKALRGGVEVG